jgi:hypothetical protein
MKEGLRMSPRRSLQAAIKATTVEMSERAAISSRRSDGSVHSVDAGGASTVQVLSRRLSHAAIVGKPDGRAAEHEALKRHAMAQQSAEGPHAAAKLGAPASVEDEELPFGFRDRCGDAGGGGGFV